MKKQLILLIAALTFMAPSAGAQALKPGGKNRHKEIMNMYEQLYMVYTGEDKRGKIVRETELVQYRNEVCKFAKDPSYTRLTENYPIVRHLFNHMIAASDLTPDTLNACRHLQLASEEVQRLFNSKVVNPNRRDAILQDYLYLFGLEIPKAVDDMYQSKFNRRYQIVPSLDCAEVKKDTTTTPPPPPVPPAPPVPPSPRKVTGDSGMTYLIYPNDSTAVLDAAGTLLATGPTPHTAIQRVLDKGRFKTSYLEATPVRLGRHGFLPTDGEHSFYDVLLKSNTLGDTLLFPPGKYFIPFDRTTGRWEDYTSSLNEFSDLLFDFLKDFDGAFEMVLIGSADAAPLSKPLPLTPPYHIEPFNTIPLTNYRYTDGGIEYFEDQVEIGAYYDNNELPDLRAAYIRKAFLDEPEFRSLPVRVIKGQVTKTVTPLDRNVTILLYINWDLINGKLQHQGIPPSPFEKAKP